MSVDEDPRPRRTRGSTPVGETLGGILAGFDQQVLRRQPPAHELVLKGSPVRGLAGDDPGDLEIVLPGRPGAVSPGANGEGSPGGEDGDVGGAAEGGAAGGGGDVGGGGEGGSAGGGAAGPR